MTEPNPDSAADEPGVDLDLDAYQREGGTPKPFIFKLEGKRFMFSDPQSIDWQDLLAAMRDPVLFIRKVLPADSHHEFFNCTLPSWKMNALISRYQKHYGLPDAVSGDR